MKAKKQGIEQLFLGLKTFWFWCICNEACSPRPKSYFLSSLGSCLRLVACFPEPFPIHHTKAGIKVSIRLLFKGYFYFGQENCEPKLTLLAANGSFAIVV